LFEQGHLFKNQALENDIDHAQRFAEMISLLGPPPLEFLRRSEESLKFWDENGKCTIDFIALRSQLICCRKLEELCQNPRAIP
jgi:hypothetical protein